MKPSDFTAQKIYISHSSVVSRTIPPKVHHITIEIYGFPSELRIDTHSANFLISRGYPRTNHPRDTGVQQRVRKREIDLSSGPVEYTLTKKKNQSGSLARRDTENIPNDFRGARKEDTIELAFFHFAGWEATNDRAIILRCGGIWRCIH